MADANAVASEDRSPRFRSKTRRDLRLSLSFFVVGVALFVSTLIYPTWPSELANRSSSAARGWVLGLIGRMGPDGHGRHLHGSQLVDSSKAPSRRPGRIVDIPVAGRLPRRRRFGRRRIVRGCDPIR